MQNSFKNKRLWEGPRPLHPPRSTREIYGLSPLIRSTRPRLPVLETNAPFLRFSLCLLYRNIFQIPSNVLVQLCFFFFLTVYNFFTRHRTPIVEFSALSVSIWDLVGASKRPFFFIFVVVFLKFEVKKT